MSLPAKPAMFIWFGHALKFHVINVDRLARAAAAGTGTMRLAARPLDPVTFLELIAMQAGVLQRFAALEQAWVVAWENWWRYAAQLDGANTLSKFLEREGNILAQAMAQVMQQSTDISGLLENFEVDYAYWVSEKLKAINPPGGAAGRQSFSREPAQKTAPVS